MKFFSTPADFKNETIQDFYELNSSSENSKVIETYGQVTVGNIIKSGRVTDVLPQVDFTQLEKYVKYSTDRGIDFNYTINAACNGNMEFTSKGQREFLELIRKLYNIGINNLTLTSPSLIELVNGSGLKFNIKASAICEIMSPDKALFYKNLGVTRVVIDPDITRNFDKIQTISEVFGDGVEIIINNVCYKNCAYKMFHYNHEAHCTSDNTNQEIKDYYFNRCSMQKAGRFENPIKLNWIRPEDLQYYQKSGINYFKLQGRQNVLKGDIVKTVKHYFNESYEGNLFELITIFAPYNSFQPYIENKKLDGFVKQFYDHPDFCKCNCLKCNYCDRYAEKSMNKEEAIELNRQALKFYTEYDKFSIAIKDINSEYGYNEKKYMLRSKEFTEKFDFEEEL